MPGFEIIALDADDTLWQNERLYAEAEADFIEIVSKYYDREAISERLYETEMRNMRTLGYGIKAFTLSMIETSIELSGGQITSPEIKRILDHCRRVLTAPVELFPYVAETVPLLAKKYTLMLLTKGDLLDQESKLNRSGLEPYFRYVEIISDKNAESYRRIFARYGVAAENFLMVGNSLKSDILPALEVGAHAVHIPFDITWKHEMAEAPSGEHPGYYTLRHMGELPALLERINPAG